MHNFRYYVFKFLIHNYHVDGMSDELYDINRNILVVEDRVNKKVELYNVECDISCFYNKTITNILYYLTLSVDCRKLYLHVKF